MSRDLKNGIKGLVDEVIETDILVIGGGLAGCVAAVEAASHTMKVTLAVEGKVGKSGNTPFAGGVGGGDFMADSASISTILGLDDLGPEKPDMRDSPDLFKQDILDTGRYINNQRLVQAYVSEAPRFIKRLMKGGLKIKAITSAHGSRYPRGVIVLARHLATFLIKNINQNPINLLEDSKIIDLLTKDDRCVGAIGIRINTGDVFVVIAKAVVIATGGWHAAYHATSGSDELTGDGQAMAYRAGAELVDMEMVRFVTIHLIWPPIAWRDHFVLAWTNDLSLIDKDGLDIIGDAPTDVESRRVYVTRKIADKVADSKGGEHGGIYLKNPKESVRDAFIKMKTLMKDWPATDNFEVNVGCSYFSGGIKVNERMETKILGLYAAGEVTGGMFGARRVASALTEATVEGSLAGLNAAEYAQRIESVEKDIKQIAELRNRLFSPLENTNGVKPIDLKRKVWDLTSKTLGLHRREDHLRGALKEIMKYRKEDIPRLWVSGTKSRKVNREWIECLSLENTLLCLEASAISALMRTESRGFHRRVDYPHQDDDNWMKNIVIRRQGDQMKAHATPVIK